MSDEGRLDAVDGELRETVAAVGDLWSALSAALARLEVVERRLDGIIETHHLWDGS